MFFFTLVTGPSRSSSLKLSDARVYEPEIRARLGTTAHFCKGIPPPFAGAAGLEGGMLGVGVDEGEPAPRFVPGRRFIIDVQTVKLYVQTHPGTNRTGALEQ